MFLESIGHGSVKHLHDSENYFHQLKTRLRALHMPILIRQNKKSADTSEKEKDRNNLEHL